MSILNFKNSQRYMVSPQEDYQPNSNNRVLKNYFGITSEVIINQLEAQELKRTELALIEIFDKNHRFTIKDICDMHALWLKDIYPFAGQYRKVNMSKGDFPFAAANYIPTCIQKFEDQYLAQYTPCHQINTVDLAYALGVVHVEFILIHPFREGNGRIGRLLASLMALQAGKPPLNFSTIDQTTCLEGFKTYISAIHAGHEGNYQPIQNIFKEILETFIEM